MASADFFEPPPPDKSADGSVATAKRTIGVFNTYALNKIQRGVLTPRVAVKNPVTLPSLLFLPAQVICSFTVTNLENEQILFSEEKHEWLSATAEKDPAPPSVEKGITHSLSRRTTVASAAVPAVQLSIDRGAESISLRIPARSTVTVERLFPADVFKGDVFGVAIHLRGHGE